MQENLSIIVAVARNGAIGKDNRLLWHLSDDLKHFKRITTGHAVVMGRKTFESLGRPLPNRRNVVISAQAGYAPAGAEVFPTPEAALAATAGEDEVFVIGGGRVYAQLLPQASKLYLTVVERDFEADTFFPPVDFGEWELLSEERREENGTEYFFRNYRRK